ncbi:MAG: hypothetical protein N3B10_00040 [Armatimonadetes bacterium]|nr:hypothetical protein [Armatimonadota bacterium]
MAAYVEIEVAGLRERQRLLAVVDTGFDGFVCLPLEVAVTLGLELSGSQWVQYADGRVVRELVFVDGFPFWVKSRKLKFT